MLKIKEAKNQMKVSFGHRLALSQVLHTSSPCAGGVVGTTTEVGARTGEGTKETVSLGTGTTGILGVCSSTIERVGSGASSGEDTGGGAASETGGGIAQTEVVRSVAQAVKSV
jgi:hypothetical protein